MKDTSIANGMLIIEQNYDRLLISSSIKDNYHLDSLYLIGEMWAYFLDG